MAHTGGKSRVRKVKKTKAPAPFWVVKTVKFFRLSVKLSIAGLILYICWLIYVQIYEAWFLAYLPIFSAVV